MTESSKSSTGSEPPQGAGEAFQRLVNIIARLRGPGGCPWDREQTHATLRAHLIEEAYEAVDAIEQADHEALRDELGDVLMQPVLHAQIAGESGRFSMTEVVDGISNKLVRRHPHVFGDVQVSGSDEVLHNWHAIKQAEKAGQVASEASPSLLDGVVTSLPALALALEVSKRAARAGFEWPHLEAVIDKVREEVAEMEAELHTGDAAPRTRVAEELGDLLFTLVNVARWQGIDAELCLRDTVNRFSRRFRAMEAEAAARQICLSGCSPDEWESMWQAAKWQAAKEDERA